MLSETLKQNRLDSPVRLALREQWKNTVPIEEEKQIPLGEQRKGVVPIKEKERQTLNEGKLILVGRGEVGKTSLVKRLVFSTRFNSKEGMTKGIDILRWSVPCDSEEVQLNIWDFGGQEIMRATHQFFLTEQSLYLLVLNGRGGSADEDAEQWLKHIETFLVADPR